MCPGEGIVLSQCRVCQVSYTALCAGEGLGYQCMLWCNVSENSMLQYIMYLYLKKGWLCILFSGFDCILHWLEKSNGVYDMCSKKGPAIYILYCKSNVDSLCQQWIWVVKRADLYGNRWVTYFSSHFVQSRSQISIYIVHCTLHTAHCTLHTAHCTLHTAHCTLHTAHCTPNTTQCYQTIITLR